MSQTIAILASSASIIVALAVVVWAHGKITRVKGYDHFFAKFIAGAYALQADPQFPRSLAASFVAIAPEVHSSSLADFVAARPLTRRDSTPEDAAVLNSLSEKQAEAYLRTCLSLLTALSYRSKRYGAKYRERLYDRAYDRQVVVRLAHNLREQPAHHHCAA
jgi:hypothetical protein